MSGNLDMKCFGLSLMSLSKSTGLVILVLFGSLFPCNGYLASILEDGGSVSGGYIFRIHPTQGEPKPPFLNHPRVSRGPVNERLSASGETRLVYLKPPSFTHKYLPNQQMSKYYQNSPAIISSSINSLHPGGRLYRKPGMERNFQEGPEEDNVLSQEDPTFTPYISARALSNMGKFLEHLRENLEVLEKDESSSADREVERRGESAGVEDNVEDFTGQSSSREKSFPQADYLHSGHDWKPIASGDLGLKKVRSFFPLTRPTDSRRMGTNFGIGRKRRR